MSCKMLTVQGLPPPTVMTVSTQLSVVGCDLITHVETSDMLPIFTPKSLAS